MAGNRCPTQRSLSVKARLSYAVLARVPVQDSKIRAQNRNKRSDPNRLVSQDTRKVGRLFGDMATTLSAANGHTIDSVAHVDFYNSIKIRSLIVPEGVDWTSASGIFLLGCEGDFNDDTDVDGCDLAVFVADFDQTDCNCGPTCEGNFDGDNDVDGSDLAIFAADFGRTDCP